MPEDVKIDETQPVLQDQSFQNRNMYINTHFDKNKDYFHIMGHEESHAVRRKQILEKHPEIKILFGPDPASIWVALGCMLLQFSCCQYFANSHIVVYLLSAYFIGAFASHSIFILVHDLTHFTCFENLLLNRLFAILVDSVTGIPHAMTFQRYHQDHHTYMNIEGKDCEVPAEWEIRLIKGKFTKTLFLIGQVLFLTLRPLIHYPKRMSLLEAFNWLFIAVVDYTIFVTWGPYALLWIIMSTAMALGLHPLNGHVIAEHYEFVKGLESYDYIGWANVFNQNVGYHIEHHDFPMIPWTRLYYIYIFRPLLRKFAPEFYENIPHHTSYLEVFWRFIFDDEIGQFSHIVRREVK